MFVHTIRYYTYGLAADPTRTVTKVPTHPNILIRGERMKRCIGRSGAAGPLHRQTRVSRNGGGQYELIYRV